MTILGCPGVAQCRSDAIEPFGERALAWRVQCFVVGQPLQFGDVLAGAQRGDQALDLGQSAGFDARVGIVRQSAQVAQQAFGAALQQQRGFAWIERGGDCESIGCALQ